MKIIRTARFDELPGDPGLPPGVTNRMIDDQAGPNEDPNIYGQETYYEIDLDWDKLIDSHLSLGYDVSPEMDAINGVVSLGMTATFDWEKDPLTGYSPKNVRVKSAIVSIGGRKIPVNDPDLLYRLGEEFDEEIAEDVKANYPDMELPQI